MNFIVVICKIVTQFDTDAIYAIPMFYGVFDVEKFG